MRLRQARLPGGLRGRSRPGADGQRGPGAPGGQRGRAAGAGRSRRRAARAVFARAGAILGRAVANLVNIFDPQRIIISGEGARVGKWLFDPMCAAVDQHAMPALRQDVLISVEPWGDDAWARGAASLVLRELFEFPCGAMPAVPDEKRKFFWRT